MGNLPIQQQWIYDWFASDANLYISITVTIVALIVHPLLLSLHLYRKVIKKCFPSEDASAINNTETISRRGSATQSISMRSRSRSGSTHKSACTKNTQVALTFVADITTLVAIVFGFLATIISLVNYLRAAKQERHCLSLTIAQNIAWIVTKLCIYQVIIVRMQLAFWGSEHEYNRWVMLTAYIVVTLICVACIAGSFTDVQSIHFMEGWCLFIIPTWLILLPCALDLCSCVFLLFFFMRPLKQMLAKVNLKERRGSRVTFSMKFALSVSQLITKLVLLSIISVLSNLVGGIMFAVTDIALGSFIDTLINPICLVLMEAAHVDVYRKLCTCCHTKLHRCLHKHESIRSTPFGQGVIKEPPPPTKPTQRTLQLKVEAPSYMDKVVSITSPPELSTQENETP
mmetsp:Transcript_25811/g.42168  ORF Transcript_25811/g.42168 Transcript_25811/m.42168 type:complete len:400 (+) Transcript_25811:34-1233(+)